MKQPLHLAQNFTRASTELAKACAPLSNYDLLKFPILQILMSKVGGNGVRIADVRSILVSKGINCDETTVVEVYGIMTNEGLCRTLPNKWLIISGDGIREHERIFHERKGASHT